MDLPAIHHISLCSGYGGIDIGLRRCLPSLRTVAYSEIEATAVEVLLARMEERKLDAAPIWSDLETFPWESFAGKVDILSGGYPCQPFSTNGKRQGEEDERHLWPSIARGVSILRPGLCFFENVEGHVTLGLRDVLWDLGELGYRSTWGIFSARECGGPHLRRRVFVLAHDPSERMERYRPTWEQEPQPPCVFGVSRRSSARTDWTDGTTEPVLVRMADGGASWVDRMRLLGNGVVPAVAALAYRILLKELTSFI